MKTDDGTKPSSSGGSSSVVPAEASNFIAAMWQITSVQITFCVVGIVGSLLLYGVLQERIMTIPYGEDEERFKYSVFLVLNNRLVSMMVAVVVLGYQRASVSPIAPWYKYGAVSFSNVVATTCQYEALKYVSFPVQTLGKCAKMIPVMIWGFLIMGKRYGVKDFIIAAGVTGGCTMFALYGSIGSKVHSGADSSIYGILLMCGYLGFDGFTSTFQDKLFKGYQMETYNQMLWVNFFSTLVSLMTLFSANQLFPAIAFVLKYPSALVGIFSLSLASTTGQLFILFTIKRFGALLFATIMTTRQFLSILLSCILFFHPLTLGQWVGTVIVFGSLYYKSIGGKGHSKGAESGASGKDNNSGASEKDPLLASKTPSNQAV